jgi:hypothetical protein
MQYISEKGSIIEATQITTANIEELAQQYRLRIGEQRVEVEDGVLLRRGLPIPRRRGLALIGDYLVDHNRPTHGHPDARRFPEVQPQHAFERRYRPVEPEPEVRPKRSRRRSGS